MAQNEESRLTEWSSWECKSRKIFVVIGRGLLSGKWNELNVKSEIEIAKN